LCPGHNNSPTQRVYATTSARSRSQLPVPARPRRDETGLDSSHFLAFVAAFDDALAFAPDMGYTHVAVTAEIIHDLPPEELRFHWKSGRLCLDFVATVGERWRRSFERLLGPEDLARWLVDSGMLLEPPRVAERQLKSGRSLREAINRLARPGVEPAVSDRAELNRWAGHAPLAPQLTDHGELVWVSERSIEASFATIARDAVDLLSGPLAGRIRECSASDCALLFVDKSRPGHRRWCSGAVCGNRTRTQAYRRRRKARG
jgi:predicted RNA-binding Zn ribbon-like protein